MEQQVFLAGFVVLGLVLFGFVVWGMIALTWNDKGVQPPPSDFLSEPNEEYSDGNEGSSSRWMGRL